MNRKDFLINTCTACIAATVLPGLLSSCRPVQYITGTMNQNGLTLSMDDFITKGNNKDAYHSFIIVRNEALQYPICVYRINEKEYSALWMRCTHQGAELQVSGDHLHCPAHGSEFNNHGKMTNGPAEQNLRSFPVTINQNEIFIDLRKQ